MKARIAFAAMITTGFLTATDFLNWMDGIAQKPSKNGERRLRRFVTPQQRSVDKRPHGLNILN